MTLAYEERSAPLGYVQCDRAPDTIPCACCDGTGMHGPGDNNPNVADWPCDTCDGHGALEVRRVGE